MVITIISNIIFLGIGLYLGRLIPKETEIINPSKILGEDEECFVMGGENDE